MTNAIRSDNAHDRRRMVSKELRDFLSISIILLVLICLNWPLFGFLEYLGKRFEVPYMSDEDYKVCWKCGSPGSIQLIQYHIFALGGPTAVIRAPGHPMMVNPRPIPGVYCESCATKMDDADSAPIYWQVEKFLEGIAPFVIGIFSIGVIFACGRWIHSLVRRSI